MFGRLFGFGTVSISGRGLKLGRQFVAEPFEFAKIITREMEKNQRAFVVEEKSREKYETTNNILFVLLKFLLHFLLQCSFLPIKNSKKRERQLAEFQ